MQEKTATDTLQNCSNTPFSDVQSVSLLTGSPVGLKSKRFVFEILLAREIEGRGLGKREEKESRQETPGFLSIQRSPTSAGF